MGKALPLLTGCVLVTALAVAAWRAAAWPSLQPDPAALTAVELSPDPHRRLAEALAFETVSRPDQPPDAEVYEAFLHWLAEQYPRTFGQLEVERVGGLSLLLSWAGADPALEPMLLMAHYDVVPVEAATRAEWTHPPFAGAIADGQVWGRGALDNKSGVLGILEAIEGLLAAGFTPRRGVLVAIGHDEEVGGGDGAARIAARLGARGVRLAFVLDEGGAVLEDLGILDHPVAMVGTAEKGYLSLRLTARAPGGHSSQPPPQTAVAVLAAALARLPARLFDARLQPPVTDTLDHLAGELGFGWRLLLVNRWLSDGLLRRALAEDPLTDAWLRTTLAPTLLAAGEADNVLPQQAEAVINLRLLPGDTLAGVKQAVTAAIGDPRIEIGVYGSPGVEPSSVTPADDETFAALGAVIRGVWPDVRVLPYLVAAATDSRHFQPLTDRIYRFLPVRLTRAQLAGIHGTDERVDIASYEQGIQFYAALIRSFGE